MEKKNIFMSHRNLIKWQDFRHRNFWCEIYWRKEKVYLNLSDFLLEPPPRTPLGRIDLYSKVSMASMLFLLKSQD